jgi:spore maturation protein CgeB
MRIVFFVHSLASCWNHGNAHFLRGIMRELLRRGIEVQAFEPEDGWSRANLVDAHGPAAAESYRSVYPELGSRLYAADLDLDQACEGADLVIVHEWNPPELLTALAGLRRRGARFTLLFHDTHHRAVSEGRELRPADLDGFDGVLAFGETLAEVYRGWGWGRRVFVWHEAADVSLFRPPEQEQVRDGLVWIGNWGDSERTLELEAFLLEPARAAGAALDIHGVRYPPEALALLERYGAVWRGWLPNVRVPEVFARHLATVHVPRRFYAQTLPGIPTIRVFEALACGIPLACAPWKDSEGLFRPGEDYLVGRTGQQMAEHLRDLRHDADLRASLAANGLKTIRARHTCAHRVDQLMEIMAGLADEPGVTGEAA